MFLKSSISGSQVARRHYSLRSSRESRSSSQSGRSVSTRRGTAAGITSYSYYGETSSRILNQSSLSFGVGDLSSEKHHLLELLPEFLPSAISSPRPSTRSYTSSFRSSLTSINVRKRIKIIIQRTTFETFDETLARVPASLLGNKLERSKYYNDTLDAFVFEDRCPRSFNAILFYYQSDGILSRPNDVPRMNFIEELEFFWITKFLDTRQEQDAYYLKDLITERALSNESAISIKECFWRFLIHKNKTCIGKVWTRCHLLLTVLSVVLICVKTLPLETMFNFSNVIYSQMFLIDFCFNMIYTLELGGLVLFSPDFEQYLCTVHGVFDIFTPVFYYLFFFLTLYSVTHSIVQRMINFLLTTRVFKLFKFFDSSRHIFYTLKETRYYLQLFATSSTIIFFWFAVIIYVVENDFRFDEVSDGTDTSIVSISDAVWYIVVTITGVGYGDVYPSTIVGKMFGGAFCLIGLLLFCLPTSVLMYKFIDFYFLAKAFENEEEKQRILSTREELLTS